MNRKHRRITLGQQREDVQITLPQGHILAGAIGTTLEDFLQEAETLGLVRYQAPLIAAICDGTLRELSYAIQRDAHVTPVTLAHSDGGRIYRRSLVLLLATAIDELWPGTQVSVNYAVRDGGFYCELVNRAPFSQEELEQLQTTMQQMVTEDHPITRETVTVDEARALFLERGDEDKVRLLDTRRREHLPLYSLKGRQDYYFGYMVPSTRYLYLYKLIPLKSAFILQYPRREAPHVLRPLRLYEKLSTVFRQADAWLERLAIEDIGRLNKLAQSDKMQEIILVAEALHERNVANIANEILTQHEQGARIVLIAGPSSSGKTTFSKRLSIQLLANGLRPFTIEMDNYFVDRAETPLDDKGDYDFESLYALNRELLNEHLLRLMRGEEVQLPHFDFHQGKSRPGQLARLTEKQIIILEGIHGLNPELLPNVPTDNLFRVYVSVMTQLNIDLHNRIPTTDVRLLRRIVRDATHRGYSAADTLLRWQSVRRGEKRNIFPHQENADIMFNSALAYELAALRPLAEPLLLQVPPQTQAHIEAKRLFAFLQWVEPLSSAQTTMIPDTSLLREFIGGSVLAGYHPADGNVS